MILEDLVGLHKLSGVDMNTETVKYEWGDGFESCQVINFVLDKKTYTAIEDPSDGYRSSMREIKITKTEVKNTFPPVPVLGVMRVFGRYSGKSEAIDFYDTKNGKLILSVGTDNIDDYYPSFVYEFTPENMSINAGVK